MEYEIYCDGKLIAEFVYETDRNHCLEILLEMHPDCEFTTEEDKKEK